MARISTYIKDSNITGEDKVIGSDAQNNNATVNFPLSGILTYVKNNVTFTSSTVVHTQSVASNIWTIDHNMDKFPSVSIVDSIDNVVIGEILYSTSNRVILTFSAPFSGSAYLN